MTTNPPRRNPQPTGPRMGLNRRHSELLAALILVSFAYATNADSSQPAQSQTQPSTQPAHQPAQAQAHQKDGQQQSQQQSQAQLQPPNTQPHPQAPTSSQQESQQAYQLPHCVLGNETYELGERWSPNLPPFGVQVCVLCECSPRLRKSCYEAKLTCRRITSECPLIDSCPDGKKPMTIPGQCCKSCQSADTPASSPAPDGSASARGVGEPAGFAATSLQERFLYRNERVKEYQPIIGTMPACPKRDATPNGGSASPSGHSTSVVNPQSAGSATSLKSAMHKGAKNELNGIDSRVIFRSLHDSQGNQLPTFSSGSSAKSRQDGSTKATQPQMSSSAAAAEEQQLRHEQHQLPNDVQSAISSSSPVYSPAGSKLGTAQHSGSPSDANKVAPAPGSCTLGNETFLAGDTWNPMLPSFGLQVCVVCNCVVKLRRACYESRVTCRRITDDCPKLDLCRDGSEPIQMEGQCCKSCPNEPISQRIAAVASTSTGSQSASLNAASAAAVSADVDASVAAVSALYWITIAQQEQRSNQEKLMREYQTILNTHPSCLSSNVSNGTQKQNSTNPSNNENNNSPNRNFRRQQLVASLTRVKRIRNS